MKKTEKESGDPTAPPQRSQFGSLNDDDPPLSLSNNNAPLIQAETLYNKQHIRQSRNQPSQANDSQQQSVSIYSVEAMNQQARNASIAYLRSSESLQNGAQDDKVAVFGASVAAGNPVKIVQQRRKDNQSDLHLQTKAIDPKPMADTEPTNQRILNMIETAQNDQLKNYAEMLQSSKQGASAYQDSEQKFDQQLATNQPNGLVPFQNPTAAAAAERYDQRDSISTMSMLLKDPASQAPMNPAATLPLQNNPILRYDTNREPSQIENQTVEILRSSSPQKRQANSLKDNSIGPGNETSRLQDNNFGSVSTIRDEAQLTQSNNITPGSSLKQHSQSPTPKKDSPSNKRMRAEGGAMNPNVKVVIRKIARSKDLDRASREDQSPEQRQPGINIQRIEVPSGDSPDRQYQTREDTSITRVPQGLGLQTPAKEKRELPLKSAKKASESMQTRVLQIPRSKVRLISEANRSGGPINNHDEEGKDSLIHEQQPIEDPQQEARKGVLAHNLSPGLLEASLSPELPDRKRYAIKEKVSLGIYRPSFAVQPDIALDDKTAGKIAAHKSGQAAPSHSYFGRARGINVSDEKVQMNTLGVSPKIAHVTATSAGQSHEDDEDLLIQAGNTSQVSDSNTEGIRRISHPNGGFSIKVSDVVKKRVRGDIRAVIAKNQQMKSRQKELRNEALESASSVVMATGINQSQQESIGLERDSEAAKEDGEMQSIGSALNQVISKGGGYRQKLNQRTPLQRGSNNSNFIKYQNSLASESVERKRIQNLGLGGNGQLSSVTDRSFSIQPQYRMMTKRLDEVSRGSSQEVNDVYQTMPDRKSNHRGSEHLSLNGKDGASLRQESRDGSSHQHRARILKSRQRVEQADPSYVANRGLRSPFNQKRSRQGDQIVDQSPPPKVPGILMDSINSQKLRSKSTFRGNQVGYGGNKLTSLQTMAYTSDQQYSSAAGGIMGLTSIQSYSHQMANNRDFNQQKTNLDRCALLEEIEKTKVEEIKQKTLKNIDKYSKHQATFNATNMNNFTNAPTMKYVPMMNSTIGSQGESSAKGSNPFVRSVSKGGSRSNAKSRGGVSVVESQVSKNSFDKVGNDSRAMEKINEQLRERTISPQKYSRGRQIESLLEKSPILVQQYSGDTTKGPRFINQDNQYQLQQRASNYTHITANSSFPQEQAQDNSQIRVNQASSHMNQMQLGSSIEGSQIKRKLNRNTINLAKLSLVLKNKNNLNVSQHDSAGGYGGASQMSDKLSRFQPDEINSIANILNETLSKLKKPNTHFLQPLDKSSITHALQKAGGGSAEEQKASPTGANAGPIPGQARDKRLSLLDLVGGIRQSIQKTQANAGGNSAGTGGVTASNSKNDSSAVQNLAGEAAGYSSATKSQEATEQEMEEEVELDLDDLTQEDKFYLIQQIEAVQKNIRYYSSNQETYVFQDFDEGTGQAADGLNATSPKANPTAGNGARYGGDSLQQSSGGQQADDSFTNQARMPQNDPRESPKINNKEKLLPNRRPTIGSGQKGVVNSPPNDKTKNSLNINNQISFVTSALGLLAQESLEIIEDADEVEEDELDHINLCEQQSPQVRRPQQDDEFNPLQVQQSEDPPSPSHGPFKHHQRKLRRNLNEGQKQILSKGDLKRYKGGEEDVQESSAQRLSNELNDGTEGPEEVSVLLHRGSRIVKDFDVLRFSKASSIEQNFLVDADHDSRMSHYPNVNQGKNSNNTNDHSVERQQNNTSDQRSPLSIRRSPSLISKHQTMKMRKLTNSLFDESLLPESCNVIKEEEKEKDEQD